MKKRRIKTKALSTAGMSSGRRTFTRGLLAAGLSAAATPLLAALNQTKSEERIEVDYIVVGAGAGGGPVAARLAQAGYKVALLEAGIDAKGKEAQSIDPSAGTLYDVPALFSITAEHPLSSWDFYVKHYSDPAQQARDSKHVPGRGVLYPRGSALGGSTGANAMIFMYPHDSDFDEIAEMTGDSSWRSSNMRQYFQRLERCDYCQPNASGHGYLGYIPTSMVDKQVFDLYPELRDLAEAGQTLPWSYSAGNASLDANHPLIAKGDTGAVKTPMHAARNARIAIREYLVATQRAYPDRLLLITGSLATRVLTREKRAIGVEYMQGANIYEADKFYDRSAKPATYKIYAKREVILSSGVFNTPQLLKLSGIGPEAELTALGIEVVADLPGVGRNLQDRYEISLNFKLKNISGLYAPCRPGSPNDPCWTAYTTGKWEGAQKPFYGPYANNFVFAGRIAKSNVRRETPDLFLFGLPSPFRGYFPGYSNSSFGDSWSWVVLKAHTSNTAGTVKLKSADPRQMPDINFRYFEEGSDASGRDLEAVLHGVKLARSFADQPMAKQLVSEETRPGISYQSDQDLRQYIRNEAWGHHGGCTAKIGADYDRMAVLDSRFRVRGVKRLRVVDASAFPRVPGFFPVAAIMMIGEKAADAILDDARRGENDRG